MTYYLFWAGVYCTSIACVLLIDKGPPREGMHPYRYGSRRGAEWMRPKLFALGGLTFVAAALLWVFETLAN